MIELAQLTIILVGGGAAWILVLLSLKIFHADPALWRRKELPGMVLKDGELKPVRRVGENVVTRILS